MCFFLGIFCALLLLFFVSNLRQAGACGQGKFLAQATETSSDQGSHFIASCRVSLGDHQPTALASSSRSVASAPFCQPLARSSAEPAQHHDAALLFVVQSVVQETRRLLWAVRLGSPSVPASYRRCSALAGGQCPARFTDPWWATTTTFAATAAPPCQRRQGSNQGQRWQRKGQERWQGQEQGAGTSTCARSHTLIYVCPAQCQADSGRAQSSTSCSTKPWSTVRGGHVVFGRAEVVASSFTSYERYGDSTHRAERAAYNNDGTGQQDGVQRIALACSPKNQGEERASPYQVRKGQLRGCMGYVLGPAHDDAQGAVHTENRSTRFLPEDGAGVATRLQEATAAFQKATSLVKPDDVVAVESDDAEDLTMVDIQDTTATQTAQIVEEHDKLLAALNDVKQQAQCVPPRTIRFVEPTKPWPCRILGTRRRPLLRQPRQHLWTNLR